MSLEFVSFSPFLTQQEPWNWERSAGFPNPQIERNVLPSLLGSFDFRSGVLFITQCLCSECKDCSPVHPAHRVISCQPCGMRMERYWKGCSRLLSPYSLLTCSPLIHKLPTTCGLPPHSHLQAKYFGVTQIWVSITGLLLASSGKLTKLHSISDLSSFYPLSRPSHSICHCSFCVKTRWDHACKMLGTVPDIVSAQ